MHRNENNAGQRVITVPRADKVTPARRVRDTGEGSVGPWEFRGCRTERGGAVTERGSTCRGMRTKAMLCRGPGGCEWGPSWRKWLRSAAEGQRSPASRLRGSDSSG